MAECKLNCLPVVECEKCVQTKCIFEGESCALSYNGDQAVFDDEDEEFVFTNSNQWFEDVFVDGLNEREDMQYGYMSVMQRQLDSAMVRLEDAVRQSLDYEDEDGQKNKTVEKK
jgi:hypothetical protein